MDGNVDISVRQMAPAGSGVPCACWSRRRFLTHGLLTLAAAAPPLARAVARPDAERPPHSPPYIGTNGTATPGSSGAVRSAGAADNRLTASVFIDGRGPYRFLVDTGAERTLMAAEIAAQLGLPPGGRVMVEGITRGEPAVLVEIRSLRMGTLVCPRLRVPVLPRAMLEVDGYLGLDVLDRHRVILDFRARTITVARPQGFFSALWRHADEAVVRTLGSSGRLRATDCLVNGVRAAAFIDTGAEVSVSNPALYQALRRRTARHPLAGGSVGLYGVTGGSIVGVMTDIDDIRLGELHLTHTPLVVAPLEVFDLWGLSSEPALFLGMDCLRRFERVSIDYGRKELRFEVAAERAVQPLQAGLRQPLAG